MKLSGQKKIYLKLIYKYAIPILMILVAVEILIIAPSTIDQHKDLSDLAEVPQVDPNTTEQVMKKVHLVETHIDGKEWELWADRAFNFKDDGSWALEDVKIRIFGSENMYYDVVGKNGQIDPKRKNIRIDGEVQTTTSNGYLLKMNDVVYSSESKQMTSDSPVLMLGPHVKGESRLELKGYGLVTDISVNETRILKDVRAHKTLKNKQSLALRSESAIFNNENYQVDFLKDLVLDYSSFRVSGQRAHLDVDSSTHQVERVQVIDDVKVSDIQRLALAKQMTVYPLQRKIVLNGDPRIIQNNNELGGDEITIYEQSSKIQIKKARAKLDKSLKILE